MAKKITISIWVEPETNAGGYNQFLDNVDEFAEHITKHGLPDIGETDFDLEIVDTEAEVDE